MLTQQKVRGESRFDGKKMNGVGHSKWSTGILQEVSCQADFGVAAF